MYIYISLSFGTLMQPSSNWELTKNVNSCKRELYVEKHISKTSI